MPSNIVLNADPDVCPAMGTWITNNTQLLSGFSLLIAEDVIEELTLRGERDDPRRDAIGMSKSRRGGGAALRERLPIFRYLRARSSIP